MRSVEDARRFVRQVGLCLIFKEDGRLGIPSLGDVVDAPDKRPGERGFGERASLVWQLKNELPMAYPDEIFYGKLRNGRAMLCTIDRLHDIFRQQRRRRTDVSPEAQRLFAAIATRPITNRELRQETGFDRPGSTSRFDRALQELQVAMLIARVDVDPDTWFPFDAVFPEFARTRSSGRAITR